MQTPNINLKMRMGQLVQIKKSEINVRRPNWGMLDVL